MAPAQGTVRVNQQGLTITFRVEGRATMAHSLPFRRFAEHSLDTGAQALHVDLRQTIYMDSTFIGDLLVLKRAAECHGRAKFALVSPSPSCRQLLHQMGLDTIFAVVLREEPDACEWTDLSGETADVTACKRNVVEAHQELASLPGPAGEPFRRVVRCLDQAAETKTPVVKS